MLDWTFLPAYQMPQLTTHWPIEQTMGLAFLITQLHHHLLYTKATAPVFGYMIALSCYFRRGIEPRLLTLP